MLFAAAVVGGLVGSQLMAGIAPRSALVLPADYSGLLGSHQAPCVVLGELWCPHCRQARQYLQSRRTACRFVEISASADAQALYRRLGSPGFPILITADRAVVGYVESSWEAALRQVSSE